jgi:hypothetical protein
LIARIGDATNTSFPHDTKSTSRPNLERLTNDEFRSWAVQPGVDLSRGEWREREIEVFDTRIVEYVDALIQEAEGAP